MPFICVCLFVYDLPLLHICLPIIMILTTLASHHFIAQLIKAQVQMVIMWMVLLTDRSLTKNIASGVTAEKNIS